MSNDRINELHRAHRAAYLAAEAIAERGLRDTVTYRKAMDAVTAIEVELVSHTRWN